MQGTVSASWRLRSAAFFMVAVLMEVWFFRGAVSLAQGDKFSLLVVLATGAPLAALTLLLFPEPALFVAPLLILVPVQVMYLHAFQWVFLAGLFAYALRYLSDHALNSRIRGIELIFLLYLGWGLFSVTQAENLSVALFGILPPVSFFLAFWAGSRVIGTERLPKLLRVYAWVVIGIGLEMLGVALANHIPLRLIAAEMGKFTDLGWGRSNYVAAVAAVGAAAVLPMAVRKGDPHRKLALWALASAAFVALASASRGGTVAVLFSIVLGLTLGRLNAFLTFLLLGAAGFLLFLSPVGQEHFLGPKGLPSIGARILFFREAVRIALSHPWAGVGPDHIPYHTYFYMDANPHNIFLKQAADLGFVGLGLYVLLLGAVARYLVRFYRAGRTDPEFRFRFSILFLVFFTALVNASYEPTLEAPQYGFLFWLMVGTLIPVDASKEPA